MAPLSILCCSVVAAETLAQACEGFKIIWSFAEQQEAPAELGGARFLCFAQKAAVQWGQGLMLRGFPGFQQQGGSVHTGPATFAGVQKGTRASGPALVGKCISWNMKMSSAGP